MEQSDMQRLIFIKYVFSKGLEESYKPQPYSNAAILHFQDSVELFLDLALQNLCLTERMKDKIRDRAFLEYWDVINNEDNNPTGPKLGFRDSMARLNKSRVVIKHHGIGITSDAIVSMRVDTKQFFDESTPEFFGIEFSDISMTSLVWNEDVKKALEVAANHFKTGDVKICADNLGLAFYHLKMFFNTESHNRPQLPKKVTQYYFALDLKSGNRKLDEGLEKLKKGVCELDDILNMIGCGIDYQKYCRFRLFIPDVHGVRDGQILASRFVNTPSLTPTDYNYCFDFIIDCALKMQDMLSAAPKLTQ
jgi:hypothetical protein